MNCFCLGENVPEAVLSGLVSDDRCNRSVLVIINIVYSGLVLLICQYSHVTVYILSSETRGGALRPDESNSV